MMGMLGVNMTPHGLPPITPSMPSFNFQPQPSPNAPVPDSVSSTNSTNNPIVAGSSAPNGIAGGTQQEQQQQQQHPGGYMTAHLHHPHGPMVSPYTPFSPGVAMSPGAFWGRPGSASVNQYINPAVGAPVHPHQHSGYFPPLPPQPQQQQQQVEEPQGYFPPFVPPAGANQAASTSKPTGLANEIQTDAASENGSVENGGCEGHRLSSSSCDTEGRPASSTSGGTTVATSATTAGHPSSSNGTSWHTDSAEGPSPDDAEQNKIVNGMMNKLSLSDGEKKEKDRSRSELGKARAHSAEVYKDQSNEKDKDKNQDDEAVLPQPLQRAGSDPVQAKSPTSLKADARGANGHQRRLCGIGGQLRDEGVASS